MKKILIALLTLALTLSGGLAAYAQEQAQPVRVASLKGPTSMGLVKLMQDDKETGVYSFTVSGTADEIVPLLVKGELDIALVPCNLASVLYNKTEGGVQVAAINTLGVLYIVEVGDAVNSVADLKGTTLYATGKGTTPEYALNAILRGNGLDPQSDLTIEYKAEATEVASALNAGQVSLAMLPQPYVSAVSAQNPQLRIALDLTQCWDQVMPDSALITGVVLMRRDFVQERPEAVSAFMEAYRASTAYTNEHPQEASAWIEELGIAQAAVAEKAIPYCNIVCIEGEEMKGKIAGYLDSLYQQDPTSVGGALPDESFYYVG